MAVGVPEETNTRNTCVIKAALLLIVNRQTAFFYCMKSKHELSLVKNYISEFSRFGSDARGGLYSEGLICR